MENPKTDQLCWDVEEGDYHVVCKKLDQSSSSFDEATKKATVSNCSDNHYDAPTLLSSIFLGVGNHSQIEDNCELSLPKFSKNCTRELFLKEVEE